MKFTISSNQRNRLKERTRIHSLAKGQWFGLIQRDLDAGLRG